MKVLKIVLSTILIVAMVVALALCCQQTLSAQKDGSIAPACRITNQSKQFVIETFGHYGTVLDLLQAIENYAAENFQYDRNHRMPLIQDFDFDSFIKVKTGVCWDFAAFAECCVVLWSQEKNISVKSYIVDMRPKTNFSATHSYNYVVAEDKIYTFDLTPVTCQRPAWGIHSFNGDGLDDIYAYASNMGEDIYRVN